MNFKPSISDEAVLRATGRSWREWFGLMESAGMTELSRLEIVAVLRDEHGVPSWWQHSIAEAFERSTGRWRADGQEDGFHVSVTRAFDFPAVRIYEMWADDQSRGTWLRKRDFAPTVLERPHTVSGTWVRDGTWVDVSIGEIADGRCRITVQHRRLADVQTAEAMKRFWNTAIERLVGKVQ